jgi:hypothetical protein
MDVSLSAFGLGTSATLRMTNHFKDTPRVIKKKRP